MLSCPRRKASAYWFICSSKSSAHARTQVRKALERKASMEKRASACMNVQVKSSQVKSFDSVWNAHRRCTTIRLVSDGTGSTVNVEGNLKRRAAILLYADPRPGTGRGRRAPRAHRRRRASIDDSTTTNTRQYTRKLYVLYGWHTPEVVPLKI